MSDQAVGLILYHPVTTAPQVSPGNSPSTPWSFDTQNSTAYASDSRRVPMVAGAQFGKLGSFCGPYILQPESGISNQQSKAFQVRRKGKGSAILKQKTKSVLPPCISGT